ncbi:MAG: 30S ribosomal protein S20 [Phycisphaerae bacterium]
MANLASAKKRIKQNERNRVRNRARKSAVKTAIRKFEDALRSGDLQLAQALMSRATKTIDQVAAKGTLHRNTAARRKSRLAGKLNAAVGAKAG